MAGVFEFHKRLLLLLSTNMATMLSRGAALSSTIFRKNGPKVKILRFLGDKPVV